MNTKGITLGVLVAAVAGTVFALSGPGDANAPPAPVGGEVPDADAASEEVASPLSAEPRRARDEPGGAKKRSPLVFPDGTELPPLNGVGVPAPLQWPAGRPFSPVVGTEHDGAQGIDWYVHADGSYTTTILQWRKDLARYDPMTYVFGKREPIPVQIQ